MKVLILGGHSNLAQAIIRQALPSDQITLVARYRREGAEPADIIFVEDYAELPDSCFAGVTSVINCVGRATRGPNEDSLENVNVGIPVAAARQALEAGVRHFLQVSSLSIFGRAQFMDAGTEPAPVTPYGRSKLAAETLLKALCDDGLDLALMRFPILYGHGTGDKLIRLARIAMQLRWLPVPRPLPRRSTLHINNAAAVLLHVARNRLSGTLFASDGQPFDFQALAAAIWAERQRRIRLVSLPAAAFRPLRWATPGIYASLYASSVISREDDLSRSVGLPLDLADGLRDLVCNLPV